MANTYLYGAYGYFGETIAQSATQAGTTPVYFGTAPVNLVRDYGTLGLVNQPVKLNNFQECQRNMGYAKDWESFTLCEVMSAHFNNPLGNIGPIYVINVLDPDKHRKDTQSTTSLTFSNGQASFVSSTVILDTITLTEKTEGTDYTVSYDFTRGMVTIGSANPEEPLTGEIDATYYEVDTTKVTTADLVGGQVDGKSTGIAALALLYPNQNAVANLLAAPGWSDRPEVYNALVSASQSINGHWMAFVMADLPLTDSGAKIGEAETGESRLGDTPVDTIQKAVAWKKANGYTSERSKVWWPKGIDNTGAVYHLSTLGTVEQMRVDFSHSSVPMETCANKQISVVKQYFGPDSQNTGFDQMTGNELAMNGISTAVAWAGKWVLWGDHTAAYTYGADVDPRAIFDVSIRMMMHIVNSFQLEWSPQIDKPMTRNLKDRIINREQEKLDAYVTTGALIGSPRVVFEETENPVSELMNGYFRWDIPVTPTPPLKAATVYVSYTDSGFSTYFEES